MRCVAGSSIVAAMTFMAAGGILAGCAAQDCQAPGQTPGVVSLGPGQSAPVQAATTLRIEGGSQGSENVLILADTGTVSVSAQAAYQVTAAGVGAAGAISGPTTARL